MGAIAETKVTITCDCGCGASLQWIEQEVQKDPNAVPDDFYRMISVDVWDESKNQHVKRVFMSWNCLRRAFKEYVPPLSPKERAAVDTHNAEVEAKKQEKKYIGRNNLEELGVIAPGVEPPPPFSEEII